ncbi:hypothetical protein [Collinsella sp. TM10-22]|uniref:hypothetical protein n=1 Tax=Collinsella sp. TM10-22 TaxID=2292344 RepID=UPI001314AEBE|nr:hypothetical protein [Collinsella sp. TM10-22]
MTTLIGTLISNIVNSAKGLRQRHQFLVEFSIAFIWNLVGILLPTIACGILLQISGLQSFCEYLLSDLSKAAFSFSSASLLCVELIHGNCSEIHSGIKWGVGILLLMLSLLLSCGLAVNQILFESSYLKDQASMSPFINSLVALSVSAYLAAMSCAGSDMGYEPDEFVEDEASDNGYIISADDLESLIRDVWSLGRSENGDKD